MTTSQPSQPPLFDLGWEQSELHLWPTPSANEFHTSDPEKLSERRERCKEKGINGNGFGLTLGNALTLEVEPSISSPPATPANPSLMPGGAWARKMTAISGQQLQPLLPTSSPAGVCSRMCLGTSAWASTMCYLTWKKAATPAGRLFFRLVPSAPRTAAIASGLLHTATAKANHLAPSMAHWSGSWRLPTPELWPTPRMEGFDASGHRGNPDSLHSAVKLWPTPHQNCCRGAGPHGTGGFKAQTAVLLPTPLPSDVDGGRTTKGSGRPNEQGLRKTVLLPRVAHRDYRAPGDLPGHQGSASLPTALGGKLSAAWVCVLMGYPPDWTNVEE